MSYTEENYLKAIYALEDHSDIQASTTEIAKRLDTKASSVTDMLKKLSDKGLVSYQKYQPVNLTDEGKEIAVSIIRKHRLWEFFLVEKLNFGWEEVHEIAEQLEHIQSAKLTDKLDEYLGYPKFDPHGEPIPDKKGIILEMLKTDLLDIEPQVTVMVMGVKIHDKDFLKYLDHLDIHLGTKIYIEEKQDFDRSMKIKVDGETSVTISADVSQNILIERI